MKILLISLGTRGDCEPFLGLGEILREKGEEVVCAFPEQYLKLAKDSSFEVHSLGSDFLDLLDSEEGRIALGGDVKGIKKAIATAKLGKKSMPIQPQLMKRQYEIFNEVNPDIIVYHSKILGAMMWAKENNKKSIMLNTVPSSFRLLNKEDAKRYGKAFNPMLAKVANFGVAATISNLTKPYVKEKVSSKKARELLKSERMFYTVSENIFPKPEYWGEDTLISGFLEREKTVNWEPSEELNSFLQRHDKVLFITFGSMTNSDPVGKTKIVLETVKKLNIPAIINISGGGLTEIDGYDYDKENILFLKSVPYDWIFEKMYAVIHHGGAGTVQSSLKAGCATMAVPHAVDQPMWNNFIEILGVGPKGISIADLNVEDFSDKVNDLYNNPSYKERAKSLSEKIKKEDKKEELYKFIIEN